MKGVHAGGATFSVSACVWHFMVRREMFQVSVLSNLKPQTNKKPERLGLRPAELQRMAVSSQVVHEMEKRRFSKELYDDIGQRLSVLKLDLDWLENSLVHTNARVPSRVAQMQCMLDKVIVMTKTLASTLRPPLLDDFGLAPAVKWVSDAFSKRTGIPCRVDVDGLPIKLSESVESAVFRVIQEGLANVERHAHANHVAIRLREEEERLAVSIADDGVGIKPGCSAKPGCYGLIAMQERIFVLGGTIAIENVQPHGVGIYLSVPVNPLPLQ
jgi:signal transduction histidine kinase